MRASCPSGLSIEVCFDGLEDLRHSFRHVPSPAANAAPPPPPPVAVRERRNAKWPIVLCGLFAMAAAGAALSASPLGQHPSVRPRTEAVCTAVMGAWHAVASRVHM